MSELRKDPITRDWVCIATDRALRPSDFAQRDEHTQEPLVGHPMCPFCPGSEHLCPTDILTLPNDTGDAPWSVRVIPNKFPALRRGQNPAISRHGIFESMPGVGSHEVVIETPEHNKGLARLDVPQIERVLHAYRERFLALEAERHRYIFVFRNHGKLAGASLEHGHTQIIASPMIPPHAWQKIQGVVRYTENSGRCVYRDMVEEETCEEERLVAQNESFICFAPFASRRPFELWILPRRRESHFARIDSGQMSDLAAILKETLLRLEICLGDPPYNYTLLTTAISNDSHWHIEIIPRLAVAGGFELGSGIYINTVAPEQAAVYLRNIALPTMRLAGDAAAPGVNHAAPCPASACADLASAGMSLK